jgi:hypothetical protein
VTKVVQRTFLTAVFCAVTLAVVGDAQVPQADKLSITAIVRTFADARKAHHGTTVAASYTEVFVKAGARWEIRVHQTVDQESLPRRFHV